MNKRIFNLLIILCMLCGMLVLGTVTTSAAETSGLCGENITWIFDSETGSSSNDQENICLLLPGAIGSTSCMAVKDKQVKKSSLTAMQEPLLGRQGNYLL